MWKTRTRNKITIFILAYLAGAITYVLYGWAEKGRTGAADILKALLGSGGIITIINFIVIGWENTKKKVNSNG